MSLPWGWECGGMWVGVVLVSLRQVPAVSEHSPPWGSQEREKMAEGGVSYNCEVKIPVKSSLCLTAEKKTLTSDIVLKLRFVFLRKYALRWWKAVYCMVLWVLGSTVACFLILSLCISIISSQIKTRTGTKQLRA